MGYLPSNENAAERDASAGGSRSGEKPEQVRVAIIANASAPYRLATHRYVAARIPEVKIYSVFTHEGTDQPWELGQCADVNPVHFGKGEGVHDQMRLVQQMHERRKAGRILEWIESEGIRAVIISGYNDQGRLRLLQDCPARGLLTFLSGDSNIRGDRRGWWRRVLKKMVLSDIAKRVTGVLPMGTNGVEYFLRYGFARERMHFFPLIPDLDLIRRCGPAEASAAAARFGLDPDRRRLVFSGRLVRVKRVDLLLHAFERIAPERPRWDLVIVGDGPLRRKLESLVPAGLRQRVIWTGFQSRQEEVTAIYRNCDALVLPSEYESWALVVIEAVAAGLAVVCSNVVGVAADLVHEGVNGRTFASGSLEGLIESLRHVTDPARIDEYRAAAPRELERWFRRFDPAAGLRGALEPLLTGAVKAR
jgi:glycosyltransferase involved in cell wall biosynthesis